MTVAIEIISSAGAPLARIEFIQRPAGVDVTLIAGDVRCAFGWLNPEAGLENRARYLTNHLLDMVPDISGAYIGVVDTEATRAGWSARVP